MLAVTMEEDAELLDEVVVIGYGTMKRSDLTGAVTSIKTADITATPTTNALKSLQGESCRFGYYSVKRSAGSHSIIDNAWKSFLKCR